MPTQPSMEIKELPLSDLKPASYNPRKKLKKGIRNTKRLNKAYLSLAM